MLQKSVALLAIAIVYSRSENNTEAFLGALVIFFIWKMYGQQPAPAPTLAVEQPKGPQFNFHTLEKQFRQAAQLNNVVLLKKTLEGPLSKKLLNSQGKDSGKTALHFAVNAGAVEAVTLLIANGAELNIRDAAKMTPLHYAIKALLVRNKSDGFRTLFALLGDPKMPLFDLMFMSADEPVNTGINTKTASECLKLLQESEGLAGGFFEKAKRMLQSLENCSHAPEESKSTQPR
jgi:hypothetical protein